MECVCLYAVGGEKGGDSIYEMCSINGCSDALFFFSEYELEYVTQVKLDYLRHLDYLREFK